MKIIIIWKLVRTLKILSMATAVKVGCKKGPILFYQLLDKK